MSKPHNWLRMRFRWYYAWHLLPERYAVHLLILFLFIMGTGGYFYRHQSSIDSFAQSQLPISSPTLGENTPTPTPSFTTGSPTPSQSTSTPPSTQPTPSNTSTTSTTSTTNTPTKPSAQSSVGTSAKPSLISSTQPIGQNSADSSSAPTVNFSTSTSPNVSAATSPSDASNLTASTAPTDSLSVGLLHTTQDAQQPVSIAAAILLAVPILNGFVALSQLLASLSHLLLADWINLLLALGLRKRKYPWGRVLDSVTQAPIRGALVTIHNQDTYGRLVDRAVTDDEGRYGFYVEPAHYTMWVKKVGYVFPSQVLSHTYRGATFPVGKEKMVVVDLFCDPAAITKPWIARLHKLSLQLGVIRLPLLVFGSIMTIFSLIYAITWLSFTLIVIYAFLWLIEFRNRNLGRHILLVENKNKTIQPFVVFRLINSEGKTVVTRATNSAGEAYILVKKGVYTLILTKQDGSTHEEKITLPQGVIPQMLRVII